MLAVDLLPEVAIDSGSNPWTAAASGSTAVCVFRCQLLRYGEASEWNTSVFYKYMKNFDEALKYYQEALSIRKKVFSEESVDVAMTYNNMGALYYGWDKNLLALDYFKKAVDILIPIVGPDHRYVKITKGHIEQVNKEMAEGK